MLGESAARKEPSGIAIAVHTVYTVSKDGAIRPYLPTYLPYDNVRTYRTSIGIGIGVGIEG